MYIAKNVAGQKTDADYAIQSYQINSCAGVVVNMANIQWVPIYANTVKTQSTKIITVPAILSRISYTKDGGLSVGFSTQEMSNEDKMAFAELYQQFGWLAFKSNQIDLMDMPMEEAEDKSKTPSKRLRAVLFVLSKQKGIKPENFEAFYREHMEKLIEWIKGKLDDSNI